MVGKLLARGMLAGVVAGLLTFGFAMVAGEPSVDRAIAFEEHAAEAKGDAHEEELVSRSTQAGLGLLTGVLVFGTSVGGLFALVFAYAYGRAGNLNVRTLSAWLALAAFIALVLAPGLKYPPNPPSIGDPETIGYRTSLYFLMIAISIAMIVLATQLRRFWARSMGVWNATIVSVLAFVAVIAAIESALPSINEVPNEFPATLLWQFRIASFGMQAILWSVMGVLFGWLAERVLQPIVRSRSA